jgi:hypothetical protein
MVCKAQTRKLTHLRSFANLKNLSPQICGFAICGTCLRTAHLWALYNTKVNRKLYQREIKILFGIYCEKLYECFFFSGKKFADRMLSAFR